MKVWNVPLNFMQVVRIFTGSRGLLLFLFPATDPNLQVLLPLINSIHNPRYGVSAKV